MSEDHVLPPVSFEFLIISYKTQAEMNLGLVRFSDDQPPADIRLARHFIDILALLQEKTKGNTSWEEERLLNNVLTELRFRYLQAFEESKKKQAATTSTAPPEQEQPATEPEAAPGQTS